MTFCGRLVSSAARIVSADLRRVSASDSGVNQAACGVTTRRAFEPGLARPIGAQQLGHRLDWRLDRQHVEPRGGDVSPPQMRQANYGNYDDPAEIELYDRMLREPDFARTPADAPVREAGARHRGARNLFAMALPHRPVSQLCQRLEGEPEPLCQPGPGNDLARQVGRRLCENGFIFEADRRPSSVHVTGVEPGDLAGKLTRAPFPDLAENFPDMPI